MRGFVMMGHSEFGPIAPEAFAFDRCAGMMDTDSSVGKKEFAGAAS
jgi:hypothetical protein